MSDRRPSDDVTSPWIHAHGPGEQLDLDLQRVGKWMLFVPVENVDASWEKVKAATEVGLLGPSAKAATAWPNPLARLPGKRIICIYTRGWRDRDDARRVLTELNCAGFAARLSYKTDSETLERRYGRGSAPLCQPARLV